MKLYFDGCQITAGKGLDIETDYRNRVAGYNGEKQLDYYLGFLPNNELEFIMIFVFPFKVIFKLTPYLYLLFTQQ